MNLLCNTASRLNFTSDCRMLLLLVGLLFVENIALGQSVAVTGRVLDQQSQQPLGFVTVVLKAADTEGRVVQTGLADDAGRFSLKASAGSYQLQLLMLGYTTHVLPLQLAAGTATHDVGHISLASAAQNLQGVTITGQRPLIEQKPDRVTMHVEGSLLAAGNDAYDILAAAPSVQLIEGRLKFRGKGNVLILLNCKRLPGANLETVLASIPGDQIERIELISNPSAKYDADASGGVIEIYTKRSKELGWTANVGVNLRQGQRTGSGLNGGLRVSTPALDLAASSSFTHRGGFERNTGHRMFYEGRTPVGRLSQQSNLNKVIQNANFSGSLNYHLSPCTTLGFDLDLVNSSLDGAGWLRAALAANNGLTTSSIQETVFLQDAFHNYTLFYKHKLDSLGSNLLLSGNYATYTNEQRQTFDQRVEGAESSGAVISNFRNVIPATYHIWTGAADYTSVWSANTQMEAGLKYTDTRNQSRQQVDNLLEGEWVPQAANPFSRLGYQERVGAGYFSLHHTRGKLALQGGLRAEQTHYRVTRGIDSSYFNLFPNLRLDYTLTDNYTTSLAYAKNIRRPAYESLIPYERFWDTYTSHRGNATLRPEYAHSFSWNNLYKGYGLQVAYTHTTGAISSVYLYEPAHLRFVSTEQNLRQQQLLNATLTAPVTVAKWWSMSNSASLSHQELRLPDAFDKAVAYTKRKTYFNVSSDNTITWGNGWSGRVYGMYNSPSFNGMFDYDQYSYVLVGIKKTFLSKRAALNLSVADLFYQTNFRVSSNVVPVVSSEMNYNDTRQVRLAFTYNFGKADLISKRVQTSGNATEKGRLGM
ncbi:Outer membrane receptor for ferrienterochelin and colicins [Hymenobacter gelipurpurascens]|uniref:Outer membrane receptor for ferrienterochelin and colicins n=1 Tax=Hymenobacter gelipurpurascens TaxID=89968 RepID=A0A212TDR8_9BACT|nr:TonB-dependent receptor [Hymenobacter gelipurpurascens]SNC63971.1 Outer membrane receptor for ferrienterochelin and colicins [Hymenobacter gelipurpurascens]